MARRSPSLACTAGNHQPHCIEGSDDGVQRAVCRACGCALVRTAAARRWYFSGLLGAAPARGDREEGAACHELSGSRLGK